MKKDSIIAFIISILVFVSCQQEQSEYAKVIIENKGIDYEFWDRKDSTLLTIPLETTPEGLIAAYDKIIVNDSIICIVDLQPVSSIFIYDHKGKFKTKIDKVGRGRGEYIGVSDVNLKGDSILVLDRGSRKILYYNTQGQFLCERKFGEYRPIPFIVLDNNHFAFYAGMPGLTKDNAELIITNLNGEIKSEYISRPNLTRDQGRFRNLNYFCSNKNGIFFIPIFEDKIYQLERDSIKEIFDFQFKDHMYSFDEIGSRSMIEHEGKYGYFGCFYITDDGTFICMNNKGSDLVDICGNIFTKELKTWDGNINIIGTYKNYFITSIPSTWVLPKRPNATEDDNHALLFLDSRKLLQR